MATFGRIAPTVPVGDFQRAIAFYCDILGFAVQFTNGNPVTFAVLTQGAAELHVGVHADKAGTLHAHLMTDNLDAIYARVVHAGATIRQAPKTQPWGLRDIVIADPDGNTFEIAESSVV